jgi:hypothetical protein
MVQAGTIALLSAGYDPQDLLLRSPLVLLIIVVSAVGLLWVAVAWHRYILLDEMPGAVLPVFRGDRVFAYFLNSLLIGLVALGIGLVVFIPLGPLAAALANSGDNGVIVAVASTLVAAFIVTALLYRLMPILPASAVDKPIRLSEAWSATSGATESIVILALLSALSIVLLDLPTTFLARHVAWWAGSVWQLLVTWIEVMVGLSIITTLYGHYVEGRPVGKSKENTNSVNDALNPR